MDSVGTERASTEFTYHDVTDDDTSDVITMPVLAGMEAVVATQRGRCMKQPGAETGHPETSKEFAS